MRCFQIEQYFEINKGKPQILLIYGALFFCAFPVAKLTGARDWQEGFGAIIEIWRGTDCFSVVPVASPRCLVKSYLPTTSQWRAGTPNSIISLSSHSPQTYIRRHYHVKINWFWLSFFLSFLQSVVRTSDVRVSNRVNKESLTLRKCSTVYNDLTGEVGHFFNLSLIHLNFLLLLANTAPLNSLPLPKTGLSAPFQGALFLVGRWIGRPPTG